MESFYQNCAFFCVFDSSFEYLKGKIGICVELMECSICIINSIQTFKFGK